MLCRQRELHRAPKHGARKLRGLEVAAAAVAEEAPALRECVSCAESTLRVEVPMTQLLIHLQVPRCPKNNGTIEVGDDQLQSCSTVAAAVVVQHRWQPVHRGPICLPREAIRVDYAQEVRFHVGGIGRRRLVSGRAKNRVRGLRLRQHTLLVPVVQVRIRRPRATGVPRVAPHRRHELRRRPRLRHRPRGQQRAAGFDRGGHEEPPAAAGARRGVVGPTDLHGPNVLGDLGQRGEPAPPSLRQTLWHLGRFPTPKGPVEEVAPPQALFVQRRSPADEHLKRAHQVLSARLLLRSQHRSPKVLNGGCMSTRGSGCDGQSC
mmetsp:Transcript_83346/g.226371  ORF Transcript_83346/g.226371 Transcript_83346/m.226371 type:complete len:319 (+) Transcript_83346:563-1519(+)